MGHDNFVDFFLINIFYFSNFFIFIFSFIFIYLFIYLFWLAAMDHYRGLHNCNSNFMITGKSDKPVCGICWHCKRRQNRNVALSVVSFSAVICVPFAGIFFLHFSHVFVFEKWQRRPCLVAKRSLVIFSSNTFVFATTYKFKVVNDLKLIFTLAFTVALFLLLAKE